MKVLVLGDGGHGKDEAAMLIAKHWGLKYKPTSEIVIAEDIFPIVKDILPYQTGIEFFENRSKHRPLLYELIHLVTMKDPERFVQKVLLESDIHVGIRNRTEFEGAKHNFDLIVYIDAFNRVPRENRKSMQLNTSDADIVIPNNTTVEDLERRIIRLGELLK